MLANILAGFVVIVVGTALLPIIGNQVVQGVPIYNSTHDLVYAGNVTGASATISGLVTLFFALAVTSVAIGTCVSGLKGAGLM